MQAAELLLQQRELLGGDAPSTQKSNNDDAPYCAVGRGRCCRMMRSRAGGQKVRDPPTAIRIRATAETRVT